MLNWQKTIVVLYGIISVIGLLWSLNNVINKKNVFGKTGIFNFLGAFVVGDMVVFGFFWALVSTIAFLLSDWILFLLKVSIFWVVRSLGETIYWFNQQFSTINRNPPKNFPTYRYFKSDAVWWIHQIFWQCLNVLFIVVSIYLTKIWLNL